MAHHEDTTDAITSPSSQLPGTSLSRGTAIAGRFQVEELAGRGGMGFVYRVTDTRSGQTLALKLLHATASEESAYRFEREARLLAALRHPAIVSYVDHGLTEGGQPFLAMEWLEGEELANRLSREPLALADTLGMLRRVAEALASAHRQGIIHRDLKPSNLFLRGGRPEDVVLLDFGLARYALPTLKGVTAQDAVLGTPGYMAPEQALSQPQLTPSADIFSLGCVLFECLTGQAPFSAPHFAAVLAKILMAQPPRLATLRPELPASLQALLDRMLDKEPTRRLADADQLLAALATLDGSSAPPPSAAARPGSGEMQQLVSIEQQLVSILLVSPRSQAAPPDVDAAPGPSSQELLRTALSPYGGRVERLVDGSLVATLVPERGTATDQAVLAARCALTFKEHCPQAEVVLVTGLGMLNEHLPVGTAMDRAGRLLRELEQPATPEAAPEVSIVLDEVTAGLLGPGFLLSRSAAGAWLLRGEQLGADESRRLLGKPTPCLGRTQELALLEFTFSSCVQEPTARGLLVVAPPGMGKSRLRHEFLRRLERKAPQALVLLAKGDPMNTGASSNLLGQALRRLCGVGGTSDPSTWLSRLSRRVTRHLSDAEARETTEFLGELCALPLPDEAGPRLRAARQDPRLMGAQMGKALVAFLKAECAQAPVVLVLDDLHWSDALSVRLVDEALRELAEQPFLVLALARPEVKTLFPDLWARRVLEVPLQGLSAKAGAQLVREVLGERATDSVVRRVVEQSDGNALFLEELIRGEVEGRGEAPPETVMAVLQARLMRMAPEPRRVLMAASFFGRTFWARGLWELLGEPLAEGQLEEILRQLVKDEVIEPQLDSRFPTSAEYRFRHALVADAAQALVPEAQRPPGHRRVGAWLEQMGESNDEVLARHFQLGQDLERAAQFHTRAAERLFARGDQQGATRCVEAALACGVRGEALSCLRALQSLLAVWREQVPRALELGTPVLHELELGGRLWCWLVGGLIVANGMKGQQQEALRLRAWLMRTTPTPEAVAAYVEALALMGNVACWRGERAETEALLERIQEVGAGVLAEDGLVRGWTRMLQGQALGFLEARPWRSWWLVAQGMRDFRELGAERPITMLQVLSGMFLLTLGDHAGALEELRDALATSLRLEQHLTAAHARHYLLQALAASPESAHRREALALAHAWRDSEDSPPFRRGMESAIVAQVLAANCEWHKAESFAREACEQLTPFLGFQVFARRVLSSVLRAQGRLSEARAVAERGVEELERMGSEGLYAVALYLALAEACAALDDAPAAQAALDQAVRCVRASAADIPDAAARERFLREVPENARVLDWVRHGFG